MIQKEAKKAIKAMVELNRAYLYIAYENGDQAYMETFNNMMSILRRLENGN
tara:strand:+ start:122 stop:274 length:153 start_codon:yes stop_codon:yes gene_type:complete